LLVSRNGALTLLIDSGAFLDEHREQTAILAARRALPETAKSSRLFRGAK
jgi:hypothetical protein